MQLMTTCVACGYCGLPPTSTTLAQQLCTACQSGKAIFTRSSFQPRCTSGRLHVQHGLQSSKNWTRQTRKARTIATYRLLAPFYLLSFDFQTKIAESPVMRGDVRFNAWRVWFKPLQAECWQSLTEAAEADVHALPCVNFVIIRLY